MAERLPLREVRNSRGHIPGSPGPNLSSDVSNVKERLNSPVSVHEIDLSLSSRIDLSQRLNTPNSNATKYPGIGQLEKLFRKKNSTIDVEATCGSERVEQDEPGVYITLVTLPGGVKDLKRVRFSRKRLSEKEAEQWWAANRVRVYQQYDIPMVEKAGIDM